MNEKRNRLYWLGNAAKTRIISETLTRSPGPVIVTVFDYGCGDGGDWPRILGDHPHLRLFAFEPDAKAYGRACSRLDGCNATVFTGEAMAQLDFKADYIVSFSVLEHVVDQRKFLDHAKRLLAADGVFYLNYDDGHFRNLLDLSETSTWMPALRARLRTAISPFMASIGQQAGFQRRSTAPVVDRLVVDRGFAVERIDYHNLWSFKELAKVMPESRREDFSRWWLQAEQELNDKFIFNCATARYGDTVSLARQMVSRTLCLRHA